MADEVVSTPTTSPETQQAAAQVATQQAAAVQPAAQSAAVSQPSQPASQPSQAAQQAAFSVLGALKQHSPELASQFQDDQTAFAHLLARGQQNAQLEQLARYGQHFMPYASQFQEFLKQQQAAQEKAKAEAAQKKAWFQLPDYDPSWANGVERDKETGELRAKMGYSPDLPQRIQSYDEARRQIIEKIITDPEGALGGLMDHRAQSVAKKAVEDALAEMRSQTSAVSFVERNSAWLHARDASGNVLFGQDGKPALSAAGQAFGGYVQKAHGMGMDQNAQLEYAMAMVQRDDMAARLRNTGTNLATGQTAVQQRDAANQTFLQNTNPAAPAGGTASVNTANALGGEAPKTGNRLLDMMRQEAARQGVNLNAN